MTAQRRAVLEPSAQGIVDATSKPPFLYELGPKAARKLLDDLQAAPAGPLPIDEWIHDNAGTHDRLVREPAP
jgi:hypothetical protein